MQPMVYEAPLAETSGSKVPWIKLLIEVKNLFLIREWVHLLFHLSESAEEAKETDTTCFSVIFFGCNWVFI